MMNETRDIVVRTAAQLDGIDSSLRDLARRVEDNNKDVLLKIQESEDEASARFTKYDDVISRMKGIWWFISAVGMMAGALGAITYHALLGKL